jgi:DNA-binding transcriptional LysR family regulator
VLCGELHFGRTAQRLYLTQPRVSRLLAALEREIGGALFDRTSRRVRLTPLGRGLRDELAPAHTALLAAVANARTAARDPAGLLRIGFTQTTQAAAVALADALESQRQEHHIELQEVSIADPYSPLRRDEIDVLVNWLAVDEPDLTVGPAIDHLQRVLAVSPTHPLADRTSVSIEDVPDYRVRAFPTDIPQALWEAIIPTHTPSGRPIPRTETPPTATERSISEVIADVARGTIVHPTVDIPHFRGYDNIVLVPIRDLPPLPLGLIWCTAHENARIRALAEVASHLASLQRATEHPR